MTDLADMTVKMAEAF